MARTRRLARPISKAKASDTASPAAVPANTAVQPGSMRMLAIATPYAPMPKNMVCAKLTMPVYPSSRS